MALTFPSARSSFFTNLAVLCQATLEPRQKEKYIYSHTLIRYALNMWTPMQKLVKALQSENMTL